MVKNRTSDYFITGSNYNWGTDDEVEYSLKVSQNGSASGTAIVRMNLNGCADFVRLKQDGSSILLEISGNSEIHTIMRSLAELVLEFHRNDLYPTADDVDYEDDDE